VSIEIKSIIFGKFVSLKILLRVFTFTFIFSMLFSPEDGNPIAVWNIKFI
jgi:hypothetical protein